MRPTPMRPSAPPVGGDAEALLYIAQIALGVVAGLIVLSTSANRLIGDMIAFAVMCAVQYPFARRTWAADVPIRRCCMGVLVGVVIAAGLRVAFQ